jgi:5-hydroxyisourate hydrolase-like protein (transthyretin family)
MRVAMGGAAAWVALLWPAMVLAQGSSEISGIVVNSRTGAPVAGADVILQKTTDGKLAGQTVSDREGRFAFQNLGQGKFALIARCKGYAPRAYQEHAPGVSTALVTGKSLVTTGLRFELAPLARIVGAVQEDSGDPVPNARVSLYRRDIFSGTGFMAVAGSSGADATGKFEFMRLQEGEYFACAIGAPWYVRPFQLLTRPVPEWGSPPARPQLDVAYAPTCYPDVTDPGGAETIRVGAGDVLNLTITMHPEPAVHIVMEVPRPDEKHQSTPPQFSTRVFGIEEQIQSFTTFSNSEQPDATAKMEIGGLTAGHYEVTLFGENGQENRRVSADISADHPSFDQMAANPLPDVTGAAVTANGESLPPGLNVMLRRHHGGYGAFAPLQPDGTFTFPSQRPDEYDVSVRTDSGGRIAIASMAADGGKLSGQVLKVANQPVKLAIVVREAKASVSGIATRQGSPASGVFILLVPRDRQSASEQLQTNQSDLDGSFEFLRVPEGRYTVVAIEQGWRLDWGRPEVLAPFLARGVEIAVPADAREIKLPRGVEAQAADLHAAP